jgi:hypothetical protein
MMKHAKEDKLKHIQKNFARTNEFLNYKSNNMGETVMSSTIEKQENRAREINNLIDSE